MSETRTIKELKFYNYMNGVYTLSYELKERIENELESLVLKIVELDSKGAKDSKDEKIKKEYYETINKKATLDAIFDLIGTTVGKIEKGLTEEFEMEINNG